MEKQLQHESIPKSMDVVSTHIPKDDVGVLRNMLCPIGQSLLKDPVVAIDGYSYERMNIEAWFQIKHTSPMTGEPVSDTRLFPNRGLRLIIQEMQTLNPLLEKKEEKDLENTVATMTLRVKPMATTPTVTTLSQMTAGLMLGFYSSSQIVPN